MLAASGLILNLYFSFIFLIPSHTHLSLEQKFILKIPYSITNPSSNILLARITNAILVLYLFSLINLKSSFFSISYFNGSFSFLTSQFSLLLCDGLLSFDPLSTFISIFLSLLFFALILLFSNSSSRVYSIFSNPSFIIPESYLFLLTNFVAALFLISANDLLVFFISFELFNFSSYLLLATIRSKDASLAATLKYFLLSSFVTAILLSAILIIYFLTGSTNFDHLTLLIPYFTLSQSNTFLFQTAFILLLIPFFFKLAAAPFHFYAPDLYSSLPLPYAFYFLTLPKVLFLYLLYQFLYSFNLLSFEAISSFITLIALLSLLIGSFSLAVQYNLLRFFTFSSIANLGFLLLAIPATLDFQSSFLYLLGYILSVFSIATILISFSNAYEIQFSSLNHLNGLFRSHPALAILLSLHFFSLVGLPPLLGFYLKLLLFQSFLSSFAYISAFALLFASLISAPFYLSLIVRTLLYPSSFLSNHFLSSYTFPIPLSSLSLLILIPSIIVIALPLKPLALSLIFFT